MDSYLVSFYSENREDYKAAGARLRKYTKWARVMENVWIIRSGTSISEVRESISSIIGEHGKVLVVNISNAAWGTYAVDKEVTDWMKENV